MIGAVLSLAAGWAATIAIATDSSCPSPEAVGARLEALVGDGRRAAGRVVVAAAPSGLALELRDGSDDVLARRTVSVGADCAERASSAAVVIAAWLADVPVEFLPAPDLPAPAIALRAPRQQREAALEVGAGAFAAAGDGRTFGGRGELELGVAGSALAARLAFTHAATRAFDLEDGTVSWRRSSIALTGVWRAVDAGTRLSFDAGVVGSLLAVEGRGFDTNASDTGWAAGATAGARLGIALGRANLWLDGRGFAYPGVQRIQVAREGEAPAVRELPAIEWQAAVGLSVRAF